MAAVIRRGDRLLLGCRPSEKRHGGLWEFPGGKVGPGESRQAAIERELSEELAVRATGVGRVLLEVRDHGSPYLILFVEVRIEGEPRPLEHSRLGWFLPEEATLLPLAPADARFLREGPRGE